MAHLEPHPLRIYADTSVFGGCFEREFERESFRFFDLVRRGEVVVLVSEVSTRELGRAPLRVRELLESLPNDAISEVHITADILLLRDAYVAAGVVGKRSLEDATHVAAATVARADAIVSWNFRDIVHLGRIRGYNQLNLSMGYGILTILTPQGVLRDDREG